MIAMNAFRSRLFFVVCIFLIVVSSCKKSRNTNPFANQKIATVDRFFDGGILHYRIFYDIYNNVDSINIVGGGSDTGFIGYLKFTYIGSSFKITDQSNYSYNVAANNIGQLLKIYQADTVTFTYKNNQIIELDESYTSSAPPYFFNIPHYFSWIDGDVDSIISSASRQYYTYNKSRNGQPGDGIRIKEFLNYGLSYIKTNHLPTGLSNSKTAGELYLYNYDSRERINVLKSVSYDNVLKLTDTTIYIISYY